jgi:hypothetical protein
MYDSRHLADVLGEPHGLRHVDVERHHALLCSDGAPLWNDDDASVLPKGSDDFSTEKPTRASDKDGPSHGFHG